MAFDRQWHLLPGTLCTDAVFDAFLEILGVSRSKRRTVELSKPAVEDYRPYFETEIGERDIICGFSLGAIVAAHHADLLNENSLLLLFGINPMADDPAKAEGRLALCADVLDKGGRHALETRLDGLRGRMTPDHFELLLNMADETTHLIGAQTQLALSRPGALNAVGNAPGKVHVFNGTGDDQCTPELAKRVAITAPFGACHLLDGLMHYSFLEDPDKCAQAVLEAAATPNTTRRHRHE